MFRYLILALALASCGQIGSTADRDDELNSVYPTFDKEYDPRYPSETNKRIFVEGDTIVFKGMVNNKAYTRVASLLKNSKEGDIIAIRLTSEGGSAIAALNIASLVMRYELNTEVNVYCNSACSTIFLAGSKKTIKKDSILAIHTNIISRNYIYRYNKYVENTDLFQEVADMEEKFYTKAGIDPEFPYVTFGMLEPVCLAENGKYPKNHVNRYAQVYNFDGFVPTITQLRDFGVKNLHGEEYTIEKLREIGQREEFTYDSKFVFYPEDLISANAVKKRLAYLPVCPPGPKTFKGLGE